MEGGIVEALRDLNLHEDSAVVGNTYFTCNREKMPALNQNVVFFLDYVRELVDDAAEDPLSIEETLYSFLLASTDADPAIIQAVAHKLIAARTSLGAAAKTPTDTVQQKPSAVLDNPLLETLLSVSKTTKQEQGDTSCSTNTSHSTDCSEWKPRLRGSNDIKQVSAFSFERLQSRSVVLLGFQRIVNQYGIEFHDTLSFDEEGRMQSGLREAGISSSLASSAAAQRRANELNEITVNDNRAKVEC